MRLLHINKKPAPAPLTDFIRRFALKSKRNRAYKRKCYNLANKLNQFAEFRGLQLFTNSFDLPLMEDFIFFLKNSFPYRPATIVGFSGFLYFILKRAKEAGYVVDNSFQDFKISNEDAYAVALSEVEIERLFNLTGLSSEAKAVRDLFLIGCCTGLRFSDFSRLTPEHFAVDIISIKTKKTGVSVQIPVHWMVKEIIDRNKGKIPAIKSRQAFNKMIKRVCRKSKINDPVLIEQTEGHKVVKRRVKKYEMISSHTARRSFATNLYLQGVAPAKIMLITGHTTESSFFKYIRISKEENAKELATHPFFMK